MIILLCIGCKNASSSKSSNKTANEYNYEHFDLFRNFNDKSIIIKGLPEEEVSMPEVFDVLKVPIEQMVKLDTMAGNTIGRLLMPNLWDKTQYYSSGWISLVDGVGSFVIYVPNYRETRCPRSYLINIKGERLVSLLILSSYDIGSVDYAHLYTLHHDGMFTAYYKDIEIEEMTGNTDSSRYEALRQSLASFVFNPESYRVIRHVKMDKDGYFLEIKN